MTREEIIDKVKKLLSHSFSAETQVGSLEEAKTFAEKAKLLIDKYTIEEWELNATKPNTSGKSLSGREYTTPKVFWREYTPAWFNLLAEAVSILCNTNCIIEGNKCSFIGHEGSNGPEIAVEMIDGLVRECSRFYNILRKTDVDLKLGSYFCGFAKAVLDGAQREAKEAAENNAKEALTVISAALEVKIEALISSLSGDNAEVQPTKVDQKLDGNSFRKGYHDGTERGTRL